MANYKAAYTKAVRSGVLNLQQREIDQLPHGIFNLHEFVPDENGWWELVVPHTLNLAHNNITNLSSPDDLGWISAWKELKTLNISYNQISVIPKEIIELEFIRYLILDHNKITKMACLGPSVHHLIRIELKHNNLEYLPNDIGQCGKLQYLNISHNKLLSLPQSLSKCVELQIFEATNNNISSDCIQFSECTKLKEFDLSNNRITSIHSSLFYLPSLQRVSFTHNKISCVHINHESNNSNLADLYLGNNDLEVFPFHALKLASLKLLHLKDNKLNEISKHISECCVSLERLDLSGNDLENLPSEIALIENIKSLIVYGNPLRRINKSILKRESASADSYALINYLRKRMPTNVQPELPDINKLKLNVNIDHAKQKELKLNKMNLVSLPSDICQMIHLQHLHMTNNRISDIVPLFELKKLEIIDLSGNHIKKVEVDYMIWPKLHTLRLNFNQITDLSDCLQCIASQTMSVLDIGNNQISVFPKCILEWKTLQILDLSNNNLSTIPNEVGLMENLNGLMLSGNRLRRMRSVVNQGNTKKILKWLSNRL